MPGDSLDLIQPAFHLVQVHYQRAGVDEMGFFIVIVILALLGGTPLLMGWLRARYQQQKKFEAADEALQANFNQYDALLTVYNGYYRSLPPVIRRRFLERVVRFAATKTISCVNLPYDEKMPLLIAAAAIQISFGLDKYLLDFFDTIFIMQHDYQYGSFDKPFEGHVSSNGIYLSWDNFLKGYANYTDADNVGIHEMAHALAYVNFMAGANSGQDDAFIKRFYDFSAVARPIFNDMQVGYTNVLQPYAATNYNEFWAVSVETFFEKPTALKEGMPELYAALCNLLNQDPLLPEKFLWIPESLE